MHTLITGGAGLIGSHLARRLVQQNNGPVTVLDNFHRSRPENLNGCLAHVRLLEADVRDFRTLREALRGVDLVYHLAAQSSVMSASMDLTYTFDTNVLGTLHLLRAAEINRVPRVVFTSSREVYGDPQHLPVPETAPLEPKNPYGVSKAAAEAWCQTFRARGLEVAILRLANVYGPGDRDRVLPLFIENALHGEPLMLYGGRQVLDFLWIDAAVDALCKAGAGAFIPEPLNVGSGQGTAISDLAQRVLAATGSRSAVCIAPARDCEVTRFVADVTRARERLDLHPPQDPLFALPEVVACARQAL